jgi:glucosamine kinase
VAYYLGVDGGGSKTTCVVGNEFSILATAVAGPSNITRVGEVRARESLHVVIREACGAANIDPHQLRRACVGAAGAGREEIASVVRKIVAEVVPCEIEVVGDMQIALQAALGEGPGVVVIAGTGSIAFGRDASGKTVRAGGWGFAISDEGSAHWIGRAAVAAVLRSADESAEDRKTEQAEPLFSEMKSIWKVESLQQLARAANSTPDFAALFPAVLAASQEGDELAQPILRLAATELAKLAGIVVRRLFPQKHGAVPLAMAGGVFRHSAMIRELFYNQIQTAHPHVVLNSEVVEPVHGALQMARRSAS